MGKSRLAGLDPTFKICEKSAMKDFRTASEFYSPRIFARLLVVASVISTAGCLTMNDLRGPGFDNQSVEWSDEYREKDPSTNQAGFSKKSREIESSLGIR